MTDPLIATAASINIVRSGFDLISYIKSLGNKNVVAGYFRHDGTMIQGSKKIELELHYCNDDRSVWFYSVKGLDDYAFQRFPVVESGIQEILGKESDKANCDARFWRWIPRPEAGVIVGGNSKQPNVLVDFVIIGYKPKALIEAFSS